MLICPAACWASVLDLDHWSLAPLTHAGLHSGATTCGPVLHRQPFKHISSGRVQQLQAQESCQPQGTTQQPSTSNTSTQWSGAPSQFPEAQTNAASEQHKVEAKLASHRPFNKASAADQPGASLWAAVANMGGGLKPLAQRLCQQQQTTQFAGSGQSQGKRCLPCFPIAVITIMTMI